MYRLVIADDEFYIREGLCKLDWAAMGIEVAAACKNGAEAAKYIYENPVDILLTDISMPSCRAGAYPGRGPPLPRHQNGGPDRLRRF